MIHSITAMLAIGKVKKQQALSHICPKCRFERIAAEEKINKTVVCEKCGDETPPKTAAKRETKKNRSN